MEQLAVAVTPGLTLTDPRHLDVENATSLVAAITQSVQGFPALEYTANEATTVSEIFPATVLIDETFVTEHFEKEVASRAISSWL